MTWPATLACICRRSCCFRRSRPDTSFTLAQECGDCSPRIILRIQPCSPAFRPAGAMAFQLRNRPQQIKLRNRARQRAIEACRRFIHERIEADGTLGSYILSTIFSMFALSALGQPGDESQVHSMKQGLRSFIFDYKGELHMQPCTSTVWDTALNVAALRRLGVAGRRSGPWRRLSIGSSIARSPVFPDLWQHSPKMRGGAWGFQAVNRFYPDVDDTCAVLTAIRDFEGPQRRRAGEAFATGVEWVFAMQNRDGGFSAFDVNSSKAILERLPFNDMRRAMIDPSSADMTGRTLAFISGLRDCRAAPRQSVGPLTGWTPTRNQTDRGGDAGVSAICTEPGGRSSVTAQSG